MELKPCPFCGENSNALKVTAKDLFEYTPPEFAFYVICLRCKTEGPWRKNEIGAIKAWNTRAED